ncbi:putative Redoxin domain protein [uncultured Paludibacter sp.]|uniref:Putative Redoxin domain protein n=1 Tax=uncultured Paludibacter sp. TaxID=497635 RepID=A0A653AJ94_9BACT|nr:putative Redoxin domain protein [uncultured Paludibacter sp.]
MRNLNTRKLLIFLLLTLGSFYSFSQNNVQSKNTSNIYERLNARYEKYLGQKFPDFSIDTYDSNLFSNKKFEGKIVYINFWNKHCSPCVAEMNGLNQMYLKLIQRPDFLFVSFSTDPDSVIQKSVIKYDIKFKVYRLSNELFSRLNFNNGIPTSIILDKNGIIKFFRCGGPGDKKQATEHVMTEIYPKIIELLEKKDNSSKSK